MRNEKGFAMITALLILALLTLIGVMGARTSRTELQIATNHQIHSMCFYGAESGLPVGVIWANVNINPDFDVDEVIPQQGGTLGNNVSYTADIEYMAGVDPLSGMPDIGITGRGTHTRGGLVVVYGTFTFLPAFQMPAAPVWIDDYLKISGSVEINVDDNTVPEIIHDDTMPEIIITGAADCPNGGCQSGFALDYTDSVFMPDVVKSNLLKIADYVGDTFPTDLVANSSQDDPVVVVITGFENTYIVNHSDIPPSSEGWGVLYVDGDFKINSSIVWNGLIISTGKTLAGGGTVVVNGAIITGRPTDGTDESIQVDMTGNLTVNYRPDILQDGYDKLSGYRMTTWKQM